MFENYLNQNKSRIVGLDILRSVAILIVVYAHGVHLIPYSFRNVYQKFTLRIDGVSIFFVLSGFLIGGILLRSINNSSFKIKDLINFWIRRWFRTLPNYFFVLITLLIGYIVFDKSLVGFSYKYFLFIQNLDSPHPLFFPELWSLCVEEWFYLLFPISCFLLFKILRNKNYSLLYSTIIFLIFPLILRILYYHNHIENIDFDEDLRKVVLYRLDSLMFGVFGAYISTTKHRSWIKYKFLSLFLGLVLIVLIRFKFFHLFGVYPPIIFNLESIAVFLLLPFLSELKTTKVKIIDSFFIFISIISYSMYLLNHTPVLWNILPFTDNIIAIKELPLEKTYLINTFLFWFYTIFGSFLLYNLFEIRMTKLRERVKLN